MGTGRRRIQSARLDRAICLSALGGPMRPSGRGSRRASRVTAVTAAAVLVAAVGATVAGPLPASGADAVEPLVFSHTVARTSAPFQLSNLYARTSSGALTRLTNALADPAAA